MNLLRAFLISTILILANTALAQGDVCRILNDNWQNLKVEFNSTHLQIVPVSIDGREFTSILIDGLMPSSEEGAPCLPIFTRLIEVPQCDGFEITVSETEYDTISLAGPQLMPVQPSRSKSDTLHHSLVIDNKTYTTDAFYGLEPALVEKVGIARDRHLARLQLSPIRYNPVNGTLIVCRHAVVTVRYRNADRNASLELFNRYHSPHFASGALVMNSLYPKSVSTSAPIRYLIIAHSSFDGQLDGFAQWKRRKGFITDIVYTGSSALGSTTTSIAAYIQSQYNNATAANPAPTYVLIVGDHEQVPAFTGTTESDHITDLYYVSWTSGDNIPDCYYGRFSAQNVSQLTPQIEKTLMYEQYTFSDPSFLDRTVLVAGVDGGSSGDYGYTHADPAMDYAATNYINSSNGFTQVMYFKNNTSIVPNAPGVTIGSSASSNSATVRSYYNQGAGWINYSAHGSATSWGTPSLTTSHVSSMTNSQKFGLMIGNCCLTNKFETTTCLGEALLRKGNYCGAVGYIGGSNSTYWNEDFYWAIGVRFGIGASMSMAYNASHTGAYDRLCHTHGEAYSQWAMSQGSIMMVGNLAVESSSSSRKLYYWEIYHLMGDPSVMTYLTQAQPMTVNAPSIITLGSGSITIHAAPYAYIALTEASDHTLVVAAFADNNGNAILNLPSTLTEGTYELAASAQQYQTFFAQIPAIRPSGKYPTVLDIIPSMDIEAGMTTDAQIYVCNLGDSNAYNVSVTLTPSDANALNIQQLDSTALQQITIDSLPAGDTVVIACRLMTGNVADGSLIEIATSSTCTGLSTPIERSHSISVIAPIINIDLSHGDISVMPGGEATVVAVMSNTGHAPLRANQMTLSSSTLQLTVGSSTTETTTPFTLAQGADATFTFTLHASGELPLGISIPLTLSNSKLDSSLTQQLNIYIGASFHETFEGNTYHTTGWTQGTYPWALTNSGAYDGTYCLRSSESLTHNQTSETSISLSLSSADSVSFFYKVSSEAGYDKFRFYIDNNSLIEESGDGDWTRAAFLLSSGTHAIKFSYSKDGSVNRNSDCAWIDDLTLPHNERPLIISNIDLCVGDSFSISNTTINTDEPLDSSIVIPGPHAASTVQIIDYTVHPTYNTEQEIVGCDTLWWGGQVYTETTDASHIFESVYGCDSTVQCHLIVNHSVAETIIDTTYDNSYQWNDQSYTETGDYIQIFETYQGCDSIVTLLLTFVDTNNLSIFGTQNHTSTMAVTVYPNPTNGTLFFDRPVKEATIYDAAGRRRIIIQGSSQSIDISVLPDGVYLLYLKSDTGTDIHKVILKR